MAARVADFGGNHNRTINNNINNNHNADSSDDSSDEESSQVQSFRVGAVNGADSSHHIGAASAALPSTSPAIPVRIPELKLSPESPITPAQGTYDVPSELMSPQTSRNAAKVKESSRRPKRSLMLVVVGILLLSLMLWWKQDEVPDVQAPEARHTVCKLANNMAAAQSCPLPSFDGWQALIAQFSAQNDGNQTGVDMQQVRDTMKSLHELVDSSEQIGESWFTWFFLAAVVAAVYFGLHWLELEYELACRSFANSTRAHKWSEFVYYRLDYWVSRTGMSKPLALSAITLIVVVVGGIVRYAVKEDESTLGASLWEAWTFVIDSGAHVDETDPASAGLALVLTVCGMLVFALVVSIISDAISEKFDSLKQGKAVVIEKGHTLVLGWSDKTLTFIKEISTANASDGGGVIVILAEKDKHEMEAEIENANLDLQGTDVVVRKGSPTSIKDLRHVSAETARSLTVLSPNHMTADEADAWSLRVTLSLKGLGELRGHVVVEIADVDNMELVDIVGGSMVETVVAHNFIGRLIVQSSRQQGLAQILEDILGFEGDEFYIREWRELVGCKFGDLLWRFPTAVVCGVRTSDGRTILNPPDDYVLQHGDALIVIAEDDDSYYPTPAPEYEYNPESARKKTQARRKKHRPERVLLVGWRRDLADLMVEIDEAVAPGSSLTLFSNVDIKERDSSLSANGRERHKHLRNVNVKHVQGNPISRRDLERLPIEEYTAIFILAREEFGADTETCDSHSLASLLLVRDIRNIRLREMQHYKKYSGMNNGYSRVPAIDRCTITSEILDAKTRDLIAVAGVSDYVMSNKMVSAALSMVAECRYLNGILQELLTSEGNEIYLRDIAEYAQPGTEMSFWELFARCRVRGEICFGYRPNGGTRAVINPKEKLVTRQWQRGDKVIVIAEE